MNRSALIHNLTFLKDYLGKDTKISSVVKANAYGHGIEQFVPIAESAGIDHFAVFSGDEAKRVYHVKQDATDIMVMGWMNQEELEWAVKNGVEFFVFEQEKLEEALELAKQFNTRAIIHIEVETGMNRTGFSQKVLHKVVKLINTNQEYFHVRGLCTHYAGAESIANHVRVQRQIKKYNRVYKWITNRGITPELRHTACSAAAIVYPKTRMDMVRVGILQYGFWPSPETFIHFVHKRMEKSEVLKRVLNWKSQIMSLKEVKEGEFVSYGTHYMAQEEKTIAIIPVGYAHGYSRSLSNQGRVLIHGHRVPVIGIVNMNMLIVDVTQVTDVRKGDEVVLIGDQDGVTITLASFADFNNQLNYELLARLPIDIPRKIID
ncbi:MAG: alanine racemase [Bacteroidales bacterium]